MRRRSTFSLRLLMVEPWIDPPCSLLLME